MRLGTMATAFAEVKEATTLEVLGLLEEQDPNEFVCDQAGFWASCGGAAIGARAGGAAGARTPMPRRALARPNKN